MFNPTAVPQTLRNIAEHIEAGNWEQAESHLQVFGMDFYRLLTRIRDPSKGPPRYYDPAADYGTVRVHQTAAHLREREAAVRRQDSEAALAAIKAAIARWDAGKKD